MKREQIKRILTDNFNAWGFTQEFFDLSADAILALPLDVPLNLSIYKKARTLSYHSFCEWFNNEIKKRNQ